MKRQGGFTLPELLIAIMIASMVLGSLGGISASSARTQAREYRRGILEMNLTYAMKKIRSDIVKSNRVYQPGDANGLTTTNFTYGSWCDPTRATNLPEKCFSATPYLWPDLDFYWYCRVSSADPDGSITGKLYRYSYVQAAGEPAGPGTCGTGSPDLIAMYVDTFTVTRPSAGYSRDTVIITLGGTRTSPVSGSDQMNLQSAIHFTGQYEGGP